MYRRANGESIWLDIVFTHIILHNKEIIHAICRDITKAKEQGIKLKSINQHLDKEIHKEVEKKQAQRSAAHPTIPLSSNGRTYKYDRPPMETTTKCYLCCNSKS